MATQNTAETSSTNSSVKPFRFMSLPVSLRLMVYRLVFFDLKALTELSFERVRYRKHFHSLKTMTFRSMNDFRRRGAQDVPPVFRELDILRTSKSVYAEAKPVFYSLAQFHYSIHPNVLPKPDVLCPFRMHLHAMRFISLSFMLSEWDLAPNRFDCLVSAPIRSTNNSCPGLRTFALHVLTFSIDEDLHCAFPAGSQTARELSRLVKRFQDPHHSFEEILIVTHGDDDVLKDLLRAISPNSVWVVREAKGNEWPEMGLDKFEQESLGEREEWESDRKIRFHYFWPRLKEMIGVLKLRGRGALYAEGYLRRPPAGCPKATLPLTKAEDPSYFIR